MAASPGTPRRATAVLANGVDRGPLASDAECLDVEQPRWLRLCVKLDEVPDWWFNATDGWRMGTNFGFTRRTRITLPRVPRLSDSRDTAQSSPTIFRHRMR